MGIVQALAGERAYLDSNVFIYLLEGYADYAPVLTELFQQFDEGRLQAVTSELTLAETLVKPMMERSMARGIPRPTAIRRWLDNGAGHSRRPHRGRATAGDLQRAEAARCHPRGDGIRQPMSEPRDKRRWPEEPAQHQGRHAL